MKTYNYIYLTKNLINNKIYIGKHSSNKLNDNYKGSGVIIKKAFMKYGKENFTKQILAFVDNEETLNYLEKFYIKKFNAQNPEIGYNLANGGDGTLGYKWMREESHINLSKTMKERWRNNEYRQHMIATLIGNKNRVGKLQTEEAKLKNREKHLGKTYVRTEEQKMKLRVPKTKYKWITPNGEIKEMDAAAVSHWHPDWIKIEKDIKEI